MSCKSSTFSDASPLGMEEKEMKNKCRESAVAGNCGGRYRLDIYVQRKEMARSHQRSFGNIPRRFT